MPDLFVQTVTQSGKETGTIQAKKAGFRRKNGAVQPAH
jgi:hypothetical protein